MQVGSKFPNVTNKVKKKTCGPCVLFRIFITSTVSKPFIVEAGELISLGSKPFIVEVGELIRYNFQSTLQEF